MKKVRLTAARKKNNDDEDSDDEVMIDKKNLDQPLSPDSIRKARQQFTEKKSLLDHIDWVDLFFHILLAYRKVAF